jgi:hypothetical protein
VKNERLLDTMYRLCEKLEGKITNYANELAVRQAEYGICPPLCEFFSDRNLAKCISSLKNLIASKNQNSVQPKKATSEVARDTPEKAVHVKIEEVTPEPTVNSSSPTFPPHGSSSSSTTAGNSDVMVGVAVKSDVRVEDFGCINWLACNLPEIWSDSDSD